MAGGQGHIVKGRLWQQYYNRKMWQEYDNDKTLVCLIIDLEWHYEIAKKNWGFSLVQIRS